MEDLGNKWAHMYGYLYDHDYTTSFNLPFITEMYLNFGVLGIVIISIMIGVLMGWLSRRYWSRNTNVLVTALGVLIALPFLTPESNFSLLAGRALIGFITVYISLFALHVFFPRIIVRRKPQKLV